MRERESAREEECACARTCVFFVYKRERQRMGVCERERDEREMREMRER